MLFIQNIFCKCARLVLILYFPSLPFLVCLSVCFLRQGFSIKPWLSWNCSAVLRLELCGTMPSSQSFLKRSFKRRKAKTTWVILSDKVKWEPLQVIWNNMVQAELKSHRLQHWRCNCLVLWHCSASLILNLKCRNCFHWSFPPPQS